MAKTDSIGKEIDTNSVFAKMVQIPGFIEAFRTLVEGLAEKTNGGWVVLHGKSTAKGFGLAFDPQGVGQASKLWKKGGEVLIKRATVITVLHMEVLLAKHAVEPWLVDRDRLSYDKLGPRLVRHALDHAAAGLGAFRQGL